MLRATSSSSSSPGECKRLLNPLNSTRNSCLFIKRSLSGLKGRGIRKFISHIQLSHNLLQLDLWLKNPTLTSNIYLNQLSKKFNFKMFNWGGLMSYSQFYLVNLKQLLKVRKATTSGLNPEPAWKCRFIPGLCIQRRAIQRLFKSWNCHKNQAALLHLPGKGHHHLNHLHQKRIQL